MRLVLITSIVILAVMSGCISELTEPTYFGIMPPAGAPIEDTGKVRLEGVYTVVDGTELFGNTLVGLWLNDRFCLYSGAQVIFFETAGSLQDSTANFNGYYRFIRSDQSGLVFFHVLPADGGSSLRAGASEMPLTIRGTYNDAARQPHDLKFQRVRAPRVRKDSFQIMGNCAGGRNSERLGYSENSIEMCRFGIYLGCTGIEVDLHTTKDNIPILIHDDSFSPRTVETTYILGDVSSFTLAQIRRNSRLVNGEVLPTLDEFLRFVIDSTKLTLVWLDPKVSRGLEQMLESQQRGIDYATLRHRDLKILFGLPTQEILDVYRAAALTGKTPVLCELTLSDVRSLPSCEAWGPRWTNGLEEDGVRQMHAEGRKVYPWTIDSPDWMIKFLDGGDYDGILSNYPSMLTGLYYQR